MGPSTIGTCISSDSMQWWDTYSSSAAGYTPYVCCKRRDTHTLQLVYNPHSSSTLSSYSHSAISFVLRKLEIPLVSARHFITRFCSSAVRMNIHSVSWLLVLLIGLVGLVAAADRSSSQCGGKGYQGDGNCPTGYICKRVNDSGYPS
jgi:hypothetical protein